MEELFMAVFMAVLALAVTGCNTEMSFTDGHLPIEFTITGD